MEQFQYQIKNEIGMHARPAGLLVREASRYSSAVQVSCQGKNGDAKSVFGVMGLDAAQGDTITVQIEGDDEKEAAKGLASFLQNNL
ncbi:MAG: HPr family phosphocarrier protein [Muribaculaceae bacterium]|nr:HPr family phosphocarrier protein [Muribaculaceae bacterium]